MRDQDNHEARLASIEALFPPEYRHPWMYRPKTPAPKTWLSPREYTPARKSPGEKAAQFFNYAGKNQLKYKNFYLMLFTPKTIK